MQKKTKPEKFFSVILARISASL